MIPLIFKELKAVRLMILYMFLFFVINAVTLFPVSNVRGYLLVIFFPFCILVIIVNGYDEFKKGFSLSLSLPVTRSQLIRSKYLSAFVLFIGALVIYAVYPVIGQNFPRDDNFKIIELFSFGNLLYLITGFSIIVSIFFPVYFKFGIKMGAPVLFFAGFSYFMLFSVGCRDSVFSMLNLASRLNDPWHNTNFLQLYIIMIFIDAVLLTLSYFISVKMFMDKDIISGK